MSFKMEDFAGPMAPIAIELAAQAGYKISPQAMQAAQGFAQIWAAIQAEEQAKMAADKAAQTGKPSTEHGGAVQGLSPIDKHSADLSPGGMQGMPR
jgi:hypothetical protein